jgi:hypothetical protein
MRKFMVFLRLILFLSAALAIMPTYALCAESDDQVWKVGTRKWTIQEESNFSHWVAANINSDFFFDMKFLWTAPM